MHKNIPALPYTLAPLRPHPRFITSPEVNIGSGRSDTSPRLYLAHGTRREAGTKPSPEDTAQGPASMRSIVVHIGQGMNRQAALKELYETSSVLHF